MTNDVEKRWHDPGEMRRAGRWVGGFVVLAAVVVAACLVWDLDRLVLAFAPAGILLVGGIGSFVRCLRVWRRGGVWVIWQGAGWILFLLMLVYATASGPALLT